MKKPGILIAGALIALFFVSAAQADMAVYLNGGVSNLNPTIGMNAEFQYGYASVAVGAGIMALNDFGVGAGLRGYLFGIDGGPYIEALYGTTAEEAVTHLDSGGKVVTDSVKVYQGASGLLGWRFFFGDGWNMTLGAGAALANKKAMFVFNLTAGVMAFGDEGAQKNAEKYGKSYKPSEGDSDKMEPDMPGPDDGAAAIDLPAAEMQAEYGLITPPAEATAPAAETVTAAEAITAAAGAITQTANAVTPAAQVVTPAVKTAKPASKKAKPVSKAAAAPVKVTGAAKAK